MADYIVKLMDNDYFIDLSIDDTLSVKLMRCRYAWENRNDDHIDFLSSPYLGIYRISWSTEDTYNFMVQTFNVDNGDLQKDLYKLPTVNKGFKVSSDVINLTCTYLLHKIKTSKNFKSHDRYIQAQEATFRIMVYRMLGSIYSHYFGKYDNKPKNIQAVFESMSNRFLVKKYGTFEGVINHWFELWVSDKGTYHDRLVKGDDTSLQYVAAQVQTGIRGMIKEYMKCIVSYKDNGGSAINRTSNIESTESDGEVFKDMSEGSFKYINRIKSILHNPQELIDDDLVYLISTQVRRCDLDRFKESLYFISEFEPNRDVSKLDWIDLTFKSILEYLKRYKDTKHIINYEKEIVRVLKVLVSYFNSSKVNNPDINKSKDFLRKELGKHLKIKYIDILSPLSNAVIVYMFIRSLK